MLINIYLFNVCMLCYIGKINALLLLLFFRLDQMFSDAFEASHQLVKSDPKRCIYLACALLLRGAVPVSDIRRNIERWVISCHSLTDKIRASKMIELHHMDVCHFVINESQHLGNGCTIKCGCIGLMLVRYLSCLGAIICDINTVGFVET